jgi:hypothetical protein
MRQKITREILEGYLRCGLKGHLRYRGERGVVSDYGRLLEEDRQGLRQAARQMVLARFPDAFDARGTVVERAHLARGPALILDAVIEDDLLSLRVDALRKTPGRSGLGDFHYIPVLFDEGGRERPAQRPAPWPWASSRAGGRARASSSIPSRRPSPASGSRRA